MKTALLCLIVVSCLCGPVLAQDPSVGILKLRIVSASPSGNIVMELTNVSKDVIRVWDEDNSWGAAHWRVFVLRRGTLETFYENPRRKFTVNSPTFTVVSSGGYIHRTLSLNDGNWCGLGNCTPFNERGFGGKEMHLELADTLIIAYDVPITRDPKVKDLHVWSGVAAAAMTLK